MLELVGDDSDVAGGAIIVRWFTHRHRPMTDSRDQGARHPAVPLPIVGKPVRAPKSAELIALSLRRSIVRGELAEGVALPPEAALMEQFGVSRPTLREAFRILESERLIEVRRGARGGARVHTPDIAVAARYAGLVLESRGTTLADVYDAYSVLELACVSLVAAKRTREDLGKLRAALGEEIQAWESGEEEFVGAEPALSIHALVVDLTGNQTLAVLSSMLHSIFELADIAPLAAHGHAHESSRAARRSVEIHDRLIDLVEKRDAGGARELWAKHLADSRRNILKSEAAQTVLDLLG
jgi:DNA-binding FadR family transcriptional regulator